MKVKSYKLFLVVLATFLFLIGNFLAASPVEDESVLIERFRAIWKEELLKLNQFSPEEFAAMANTFYFDTAK